MFPLNKDAERVLKVTFLEAKRLKTEEISTEHLVLSILKHSDNPASQVLEQFEVDYDTFKSELEFVRHEEDLVDTDFINQGPQDSDDNFEDDQGGDMGGRGGSYQRKGGTKSRTPVLDNFWSRYYQISRGRKIGPNHRKRNRN